MDHRGGTGSEEGEGVGVGELGIGNWEFGIGVLDWSGGDGREGIGYWDIRILGIRYWVLGIAEGIPVKTLFLFLNFSS